MSKNDYVSEAAGMSNELKDWLKESSKHFKNRPILLDEDERCVSLQFEDVTPELSFTMCENGNAGMWVIYRGDVWDCLAEWDVWEWRTPSGQYYCKGCEERKLFSSRRALWEEHVFEFLLDWCHVNFSPSNWLCIFEVEGVTWASIEAEESIGSLYTKNSFVAALPLVKNLPGRSR